MSDQTVRLRELEAENSRLRAERKAKIIADLEAAVDHFLANPADWEFVAATNPLLIVRLRTVLAAPGAAHIARQGPTYRAIIAAGLGDGQ